MNQFRNKQLKRGRNITNSIDGFNRPRPRPNRQPVSGRLGNFKAVDGFTPARIDSRIDAFATQTAPARALGEPLMIPDAEPRTPVKQRFFKGRKLFDRTKWKRPWTRKRKIATTAGIFLAILLMLFGFLVLKGYINLNKILKGGGGAAALNANVDPSKLRGEGDGRVNIMMLGKGGEGHEGADLTDTIIIASIDPIAKEAALVSVPRDLYVPVSGGGGSMKINAVYAAGKSNYLDRTSRIGSDARQKADESGFSLLEQTIEKNLGIPIHYRATIDFNGFEQAVDTVGGIDLNVPTAVKENLRIDGKNYRLDVKPGQQHMDGFKALAFSRSRYTSARGDFDRSERQRLIILALKQKILSAGTFSNPGKISGLLDNLGSHVQTNFNINDLTRLYDLGKEIDQSKISSIGLADPPNNYITTGNVDGQSVVIPTAGAGNFKAIQGYLRNVLKDSFIRDENASIAVLNGTSTAGLAGSKSDELKSYGYNITAAANAPTKSYPKTIIVDLRSGSKKYTKNYLEKRFGVSAVSNLPDPAIQAGTSDFVIILGSDQTIE